MTSPVTAWISWPVIILMAFTVVVRFALLNSSIIDRLTTQSLVLGWVGLVLRERTVQDAIGQLPKPFGDVALFQQITFCCIVMIVQALYGMSRLWAGADPTTAWKRQKTYYAVGLALSIVILIAGIPSRKSGMLIDEYLGWPAVVLWTAFYAPILVVSLAVMRVFIREVRQPDTAIRERVLYGLAITIAGVLVIDSAATPLLTLNEVLTDVGSADPEMTIKSLTYFGALAGSLMIGAVPVVAVIRTKLGQDRISKNLKQIEDLWRDMTDQFPDVRRTNEELTHDPALQLHRRIIEIHDALLRLSKWNSSDNPTAANQTSLPADRVATEIANAYAAKAAGKDPFERYELLQLLTQRSEVPALTATSDDLVDVAQAWRILRAQDVRLS